MDLWSYPWKRWNSIPIFVHIGILILSLQILVFSPYLFFQTMEFWLQVYKDWNNDLILPNIWILALFLYTMEFWPRPSKQWNSGLIVINTCLLSCPSTAITGILVLFSQTLIWILPLFLYSLEFWRHPSEHCNSGPIFIHIEVLILSF